MCGIVGILGQEDVQNHLITALETLEYRGYDSAGIALATQGQLVRARAAGKLENLKTHLRANALQGTTGIGHIRWATHGAATAENAHPHAAQDVMLVHNGIIENHQELRARLTAAGYTHVSQTDTEVVAHLIQFHLDAGLTPQPAVQAALQELRGAYALAILFKGHDQYMIAARQGAPLVLGRGADAFYVGSDAICLKHLAEEIAYLKDGDMVTLTPQSSHIIDREGHVVERPFVPADRSATPGVSKEGYAHFMLKEIYEQPEALRRTLAHFTQGAGAATLRGIQGTWDKIVIIGCGTSYYAAMVAKYWIEQIAQLPVEIDIASEYRYRQAPLSGRELAIFISQSGETADTLAAHQCVQAQGVQTLALVNVPESSLAREADIILPTIAGPEIGVASTKAFTTQLLVLALVAIQLAQARGATSEIQLADLQAQLKTLPEMVRLALLQEDNLRAIAQQLKDAPHALFIGRGASYPIALEGALKLKEISYINAQAYAAGELKHGPIALVDESMPVIALAPMDALFEKTLSNVAEVSARGGQIILLCDAAGKAHASGAQTIIEMPQTQALTMPLVYTAALQLLAYHTAHLRGENVDQPRNLAKSVTVE